MDVEESVAGIGGVRVNLEIVRVGVGYNRWVMKSMLMVLGVVVVLGIVGRRVYVEEVGCRCVDVVLMLCGVALFSY